MATKNPSPEDFSENSTQKNIEDNLEQPTQQTKRGVLIMMVLMGILALGLLIHSLFFSGNKKQKQEKNPAVVSAPATPVIEEQNYDPATLERVQREAEERIRAQAAKDIAEAERVKAETARIEIENQKYAGTASPSTVQEMRRNWQMEDEKFALQAIRSPLALASKISSSTLPDNAQSSLPSAKPTAPLTQGSPSQPKPSPQQNAELAKLLLQLQQNQQLRQGLQNQSGAAAQLNNLSSDKPETTLNSNLPAAPAANKTNNPAAKTTPAANEQGRIVGGVADSTGSKDKQYLMPAGSVISAILDTELNTDFPGMWRGLIVRDVYDVSNKVIVVPKGAKVLGNLVKASSINEPLHERVGMMVKWITLPDGSRINMSSSGRDTGGTPGVGGDVNRHILAQLFGATAYAVFTIIENITFDFQNDNNNNSNYVLSPSSYGALYAPQRQATTIGKQYAAKYLNLVPTIKVPAGTPFKIFLEEDIYSEMWQPIDPYLTPLEARTR